MHCSRDAWGSIARGYATDAECKRGKKPPSSNRPSELRRYIEVTLADKYACKKHFLVKRSQILDAIKNASGVNILEQDQKVAYERLKVKEISAVFNKDADGNDENLETTWVSL